MDLIIVTGMSGAGKSVAVNALEDLGYYCVDNLPPELIVKISDIFNLSDAVSKIAVVVDMRAGALFDTFGQALETLKEHNIDYELLFLDCSNSVLVNRFKETRRRHPLVEEKKASVSEAIEAERIILNHFKETADVVVDTSELSVSQLKEQINSIFLSDRTDGMLISCISFGFKYGVPQEADLVFDVRCLPNPYYLEDLKHKTGLDAEVREYVMSFEESRMLLEKLMDLMDYLIPLYLKEGKSQLTVAFGCTGGKHRSVTFAQLFHDFCSSRDFRVVNNHRDISK